MNIAAYCRVSTDKEDQLNSLEAQKAFFYAYTSRTGDHLVRLYADEGISGTKVKNRKEFLRMMADAESGAFDMVVVKDISRFARNTVDLLQNIRRLKALGIETQFLTANMTSMGNSEFVLTIFGALAQEESANTSKRVKFGKRINAEKGRVPNLVYGYDKTAGDYFHLAVNEKEAAVVRQIYRWYLQNGCGAAKIAGLLNADGVRTKRGCRWSQSAVCRILTNALYTGKIINGKQEVADFLTGRRTDRAREDWMVAERPELQIIAPETFEQAQQVLRERGKAFRTEGARQSNRYLFSTLIQCRECGRSFRRIVRTYQNTYVRWVCSGHNGRGADSCPNAVTLEESDLMDALRAYFAGLLREKPRVLSEACRMFQRELHGESGAGTQEQTAQLSRLRRTRQKYLELYGDGLISRAELDEKLGGLRHSQERLEEELARATCGQVPEKVTRQALERLFREPADLVDMSRLTNAQLKRIVQKIQVDKDGNVEVMLRPLTGNRAAETVPFRPDETISWASKKDTFPVLGRSSPAKTPAMAACVSAGTVR